MIAAKSSKCEAYYIQAAQLSLTMQRCITANGKILKRSRDNNHAPFVGDMSSCC